MSSNYWTRMQNKCVSTRDFGTYRINLCDHSILRRACVYAHISRAFITPLHSLKEDKDAEQNQKPHAKLLLLHLPFEY